MYDFYFGTKEEIEADEGKYLLFIKRMMPRWCNSIPDSECLAIHNSLQLLDLGGRRPVLAETGAGASTIPLLNFAMKHGGVLYSWDFNGPKGAYLRSIFTDTLSARFGRTVHEHWKFIAYNSHSPHLGLEILGELGATVDYAFFDSEHTREVLLGEVRRAVPCLRDGAVVAIDDANYDYVHTNVSYINMLRKKLGLGPVPNPPDNKGDPFYVETERLLKSAFKRVEPVQDTYKKEYKNDLFWSYYSADRQAMGKEGMEKLDALEHRFDAWRVWGRKP